MDERPVLFLDSGCGGLPYCRYFQVHNPQEAVVYAADQEHFPYGLKDRDELSRICCSLVARLRSAFSPKLAAVVCNAASVSALPALRGHFPDLPFVGTVPAVKPAALSSKKKHIGVLGTRRAVEDSYIAGLAARYAPDCAVTGIAAPDLVEFVERRGDRADRDERRRMVEPYMDAFRKAGVDAVVLGCTHFLFLLEEFKSAAGADMTIHESVEGVSRRIEALLDEGARRSDGAGVSDGAGGFDEAGAPSRILVVTGNADEALWRGRAERFGLTLRGWEQTP
jgi:glutamate racemase